MISRFFCIDKQSVNFHNKVVSFSRHITTPGVAKRYIGMSRQLKETVSRAGVVDLGSADDQEKIATRYNIKNEVAELMTTVIKANKAKEFDEQETTELCSLLMQIDAIANEEIDMVLDPKRYQIPDEAKSVANRVFRYNNLKNSSKDKDE